jgi:polyhydroxyalkanoate synthesis repressor PhaR
MVVIKKYPNRRLYNTTTSSYVNLDEIQAIIREGLDVQIVESKTGIDVTTEMLLTRALDAELLEMLVPGEFVQQLFRVDRLTKQEMILDRLFPTQSDLPEGDVESQSETLDEGETTVTRVEVVAPESSEEISESSESESESEVTIVRVEAPPSEPAVELLDHVQSDEVEEDFPSDEDVHISLVSDLDMNPLVDDETLEPFERPTLSSDGLDDATQEPSSISASSAEVEQIDIDEPQNMDSESLLNPQADVPSTSEPQVLSPNPAEPETSETSESSESLSKADELKAKLEAMRARFKR